MRARRIGMVIALAALVAPATGHAAVAPRNDNYLHSIPINDPGTRLTRETVKDTEDTTLATTQTDLFAPDATGGGAENTVCNNVSFGNTIWYDFHPDEDGAVEIQTSGFPTAVTVYSYNVNPPLINATLQCATGADAQDVIVPKVKKGKHYTVQLGGVVSPTGPAVGSLLFSFEYFADADGDGIFDPLDKCPKEFGVRSAGGCPPKLSATPKLTATPTGNGIIVRSLSVSATHGAHVSIRCKHGCSAHQAHTAGVVSFSSLRGRALRKGAEIEIFVTKANSIGAYFRYKIVAGNFKRADLCLKPGSTTPHKSCT
jgi:hypothetical protein